MAELTHILLATDGSRDAREAFRTAMRLALAVRARLTLLSVVEHAGSDQPGEPEDLAGGCEAFRREALEAGVRSVRTLVESGLAYSRILSVATRECADLIVVGARGLGRHDSPLGDTAEQVAKFATCPVLIVR
ncbi:MAG: universal stress protein [Deltaproteobacteria bacterium]|nr:universal stress protein [Deltaproteobacteria bacterium]